MTPGDAGERRRALLALLAVVPAPSIGAALAFWIAPGGLGNAAYALGKCVLYGVPLVALLRARAGSPHAPAFRRTGAKPLLAGAAFGLVVMVAVVAAYVLGRGLMSTDALVRVAREAGFGEPWRYAALCAWLVVGNSLLEELVFRWFMVTRLRLFTGDAGACVLASLAFTAHHALVMATFFGPLVAFACSAGVFVGGLAWSWMFVRWGSLAPGWLSHAIVDVAVLGVGAHLLFGG